MGDVLKDIDHMLAEATRVFRGKQIIVNTLPEVRNDELNNRIRLLNQFILDRCAQNKHLGLFPLNPTMLPLKKDRIHISYKGQMQLACNIHGLMKSV